MMSTDQNIQKSESYFSVGVDPSTLPGLAVLKYCTTTQTITPVLKVRLERFKPLTGLDRAVKISEQIIGLTQEYIEGKNCTITIEGYGFTRTANIAPLFEIGTLIRYQFFIRGFDYHEVAPTKLKKFVSGKGNVHKDVIIKDVYRRFGVDCANSDVADAVGLAYMGLIISGALTECQLKLICARRSND